MPCKAALFVKLSDPRLASICTRSRDCFFASLFLYFSATLQPFEASYLLSGTQIGSLDSGRRFTVVALFHPLFSASILRLPSASSPPDPVTTSPLERVGWPLTNESTLSRALILRHKFFLCLQATYSTIHVSEPFTYPPIVPESTPLTVPPPPPFLIVSYDLKLPTAGLRITWPLTSIRIAGFVPLPANSSE